MEVMPSALDRLRHAGLAVKAPKRTKFGCPVRNRLVAQELRVRLLVLALRGCHCAALKSDLCYTNIRAVSETSQGVHMRNHLANASAAPVD